MEVGVLEVDKSSAETGFCGTKLAAFRDSPAGPASFTARSEGEELKSRTFLELFYNSTIMEYEKSLFVVHSSTIPFSISFPPVSVDDEVILGILKF